MIQSSENLITDEQADRTDRQKDESDFIGCYLTNVELPIMKIFIIKNTKCYIDQNFIIFDLWHL